jgi:acetylornithine deacetylase/succinyl-diaminopimelate desuccinylase-like protein
VQDVHAYVERRREAHVDELVAYVASRGVSATGDGFPDATDYAVDLARRCGLDARAVPTAGRPAVVGHLPGDPAAPHVLIYGHYDVQPPGPLDEWHSPPFTATPRDGRLYGRGTGDNKGQHLAHLLALRMLGELRGGPPCPVTVLLDGEEEVGSPNLADLAEAHRDELGADLVVWSDGPVHESGAPTVVFGVRGILSFELRATGAAYPLHSGNWGGIGPNPAWRLVWLLASMRAPDGAILVDGFDRGAAPLTAVDRDALERLPIDLPATMAALGVRELDVPAERGYHERLARPTLTINSLTCEDSGDHRTVIPNVAVAKCDVRLVGGMRSEDVAEALRRHVERVAPDVELTVTRGIMEPSRTALDSPHTDAVRAGAAAGLGEEPLLVPSLGGSLPLHVFTGVLGLPCYGVPFANPDEANHAPNENIELRRFHAGIAASAGILLELAARHRFAGARI